MMPAQDSPGRISMADILPTWYIAQCGKRISSAMRITQMWSASAAALGTLQSTLAVRSSERPLAVEITR